MTRFSRLPIRSKLIFLVVTTCGIVLLLAMVFFLVFDAISVRHMTARSVATLARTIAYNSVASLTFDDPVDGADGLKALAADEHVQYAALYDAGGNLFAWYPDAADIVTVPELVLSEDEEDGFRDGYFHYYQPVEEGDIHWGTLYISYELTVLRHRLLVDSIVAFLILAAAVGASYFIASFIQRLISSPIVSLAGVARRVSREHNFDLRAEKKSTDEVGDLTDAFNEMLTELGQKEVALRQSEERLRLAMEASQTGVWNHNLETGALQVDGYVFDVLGITNRPLSRQMMDQFIHPDDREHVRMVSRGAIQDRNVFEVNFRVLLPDSGEIRHYDSRGKIYLGKQGQASHMLGVTIDVTASRKAQEEILRLNRELEQRVQERTSELQNALQEIESFSYSVSHDLRAPLRSIDGFSRILLTDYEEKLDKEGQDFLQRIRSSAQMMGQLIEDLLMLSRVTRQQMKREPVDLTELVEMVFVDLRREEPERQVQLNVKQGMTILGDENLLRIALRNLLDNAWKFTSRREKAKISVGYRKRGKKRVFYVEDNGAGFDGKHVEKLFTPFQRLHGAMEFEGTGIGLATVKRILKRHGGKVWGEGVVGKGATFYFLLADLNENDSEELNTASGGQSG